MSIPEKVVSPRPAGDVPDDPLSRIRHSAAHVMADAVRRIRPNAKVTIGPAIETGFYYDFETEPFAPEDIERIEAEMKKIIGENLPFEKQVIDRDEARKMFADRGETYKVELIESFAADEEISLYQHGEFVDLCRGPHVEKTGEIKAFKVLSFAGSYWRGDEKNAQLQRVYGTAFGSEKELRVHLKQLEEAKKRDHRLLGKQLDLFSFDELVGPGFALFHPKGALVRQMIEDLLRSETLKAGYDPVYSPHLARETLLETSGHLAHYEENLFGGMELDGQRYLVKPMNCPFHVAIYRSGLRSFRDLPIRYAELGTVYRYERSGVLHGLFRVRGFTQDDGHLFVRPDQIESEVEACVRFAFRILDIFGFSESKLFLSTRPAKFMGDPELWDKAEAALQKVLEASGRPFEVDVGGGAFYGPKIDLKIRDAIGREWQLSTFQLDFQLPERFELEYVDTDGARKRPVMIHRALLGSVERFFAVLLEHHSGKFPAWLAPVQARVVTVSEKVSDYARDVEKQLSLQGIRVESDTSADKLGAKIRRAQLEKIPYMLVVGENDQKDGVISPRARDGKRFAPMSVEAFVSQVASEMRVPEVHVTNGAPETSN